MARAGVIGLIRTPKERLVAAILDALRHIAPDSAYHFRELAGQNPVGFFLIFQFVMRSFSEILSNPPDLFL